MPRLASLTTPKARKSSLFHALLATARAARDAGNGNTNEALQLALSVETLS